MPRAVKRAAGRVRPRLADIVLIATSRRASGRRPCRPAHAPRRFADDLVISFCSKVSPDLRKTLGITTTRRVAHCAARSEKRSARRWIRARRSHEGRDVQMRIRSSQPVADPPASRAAARSTSGRRPSRLASRVEGGGPLVAPLARTACRRSRGRSIRSLCIVAGGCLLERISLSIRPPRRVFRAGTSPRGIERDRASSRPIAAGLPAGDHPRYHVRTLPHRDGMRVASASGMVLSTCS